MQYEPISLQHKPAIDKSLNLLQSTLSEYSFANLYLFRAVHDFSVALRNDRVLIYGKTYDESRFCMPLFHITKDDCGLVHELLREVPMLFPLREEEGDIFRSMGCQLSWKDDDSDYIYEIKTLSSYPGRHLAGRRNLVAQFLANYAVVSEPLSLKNSRDGERFLDTLQASGHDKKDDVVLREALQLMEALQLQGRIYFINKKPVGIMLGEPFGEDTFLLHFAKADITYKGIYQYMHEHFASTLGTAPSGRSYIYMNWEQDLGIPGLRQSKRSYQPVLLRKKIRVTKS